MARPMTMAEKILAAHAHLEEVEPGQLVECDVDLVLANDITAPIAIRTFGELGCERVFDPARVVLVPDHYAPNKDIKSAEQAKTMRDFARAQGITHYYEVGCMGVEHALLPEQGVVGPGDLIIGADSHTCTYGALGAFGTGVGSTDAGVGMATGRAWFKVPPTIRIEIDGQLGPWISGKDVILHVIGLIGVDGALYKAMEFGGEAMAGLSMEGRLTMANMAIEAGGKAGLFEVDDAARAWLEGRCERPWTEYHPDEGAVYERVVHVDAADIVPTVSWPHLPSNTHPVAESRHVEIDQAVIGSWHQRPHRGHARRRRGAARPARRALRALHRDPRDADRVASVRGRGPHGRVRRRGLRGVHAHVRPVPGRVHGHPCGGGAGSLHEQPQLRGPHGRPDLRGLPDKPGGGGRKRRGRPHRPAR